MSSEIKTAIENGETFLGIELGSTRIKAVLIGKDALPLASGGHSWDNTLENGVWTYSMDEVWLGIKDAYSNLKKDVFQKYGAKLTKMKSIGFSAMMHGYLPFDKDGKQLASFRTWRNTITEKAAAELTELLKFNIPQRWSVAYLYQSILNGEEHVKDIAYLTTLAGYVHWQLTGQKVLGVGDASGMFPIDSKTGTYDAEMLSLFDENIKDKGFSWKLHDILPKVLCAGEDAGVLTKEGAALIDADGELEAGIPLCPPEGDAGTGMVATNSVAAHTGNISAGTSIFAMIVLDKQLSDVYTEIDMVTTPSAKPVAMVHCNTCTSDFDAWVNLFAQAIEAYGCKVSKPELYDMLYAEALKGKSDCGGLMSFNYYSGEPITQTEAGRPLFVRTPDSKLTLPEFMRTHIYSTMATLRLGMDILFEKENITVSRLLGHGGLFKTELVGQKLMAGAMNAPVTVMKTAGEGGAWGIALLAAYMSEKKDGEALEEYLENKVFGNDAGSTVEPDPEDVKGFNAFCERYKAAVEVEKAAIRAIK